MKHLYHQKYGRMLLVLFLVALVATAGATVYVFFYTAATSTVQTPDVQLTTSGTDIQSGACTVYPCASGSVSSTHDLLTVTLSFFPSTATPAPVVYPATYYSYFAGVTNVAVSASHTIKSVQILNVGGTTADLGSITVYYCTTQTEFDAAGSLVTPGNCLGSFAITSSSGGTVFSGTQAIAHGATQYIEVAAYAASGATASTSVTFQIAVQWV